MSWNLVELGHVAPSAWRNGGGSTRELVTWPDVANWKWRLSVAEVERDGPFSRFEGVERWFAVLQGQGVRLDIAGFRHELGSNSDPLCFDGEAETDCTLVQGPTQDFNLMLRKGHGRSRMVRVCGRRSATLTSALTLGAYVVEGPAELTLADGVLVLPPGTLAWRSLAAGAKVMLNAPNALWMEIEA